MITLMKYTGVFSILFGLFAMIAFASGHPDEEYIIGIIKKAINKVEYKQDEAGWADAKDGQQLFNNDEVKTGSQSFVLIKFTDNSLLRIRENSILKISAKKEGKNLSQSAEVKAGIIGFNIEKQDGDSFEFSTPTMVASIRGTEGFIQAFGDSLSLLALSDGSVEVSDVNGTVSGTVSQGEYATIDNEGKLIIDTAGEDILKALENINKSNVKTIRFKTGSGDIKIEYLDD
jgi:hypothetical protein